MSETSLNPNTSNLEFLEELLAAYNSDPQSVSPDWQRYFAALKNGHSANGNGHKAESVSYVPSFKTTSIFADTSYKRAPKTSQKAPKTEASMPRASAKSTFVEPEQGTHQEAIARQDWVDQLIRSYRARGHVDAKLDPLSRPRMHAPELDPAYYGFTAADMEQSFSCQSMGIKGTLKLKEILEKLRNTYCRYIGVQFMHIDDLDVREWLQQRMEQSENRISLERDEQLRILTRLTDATTFEEFLRVKFVGAKSFSLEGAESLIPLLDLAIEKAATQGVQRIVMGMAHRGRLNVLANIIGKSPRSIFREFDDTDPERHMGRGDVKYHLGYNKIWTTSKGEKVKLSLTFNPSHLEFANPVAIGRMRAKQDRHHDGEHRKGMVLLIHGDAAFIGEGIVQETLNMSRLTGYTVGGTLHVVVNNQIGFTTTPREGRSSAYASDIAKMLAIPIFHVNGEDPEAVAQVVHLALDFREKFQRDVVIDLYCYRRWGHNESDEPAFTQPILYDAISKRPNVRESYLNHLLKLGGVAREEADQLAERRREHFEEELSAARSDDFKLPTDTMGGVWTGYLGGHESNAPDPKTGIPQKRAIELLQKLSTIPENFHLHKRLKRLIDGRQAMIAGEQKLDWSAGEALALASIATEKHPTPVRLSGQDAQRGTFSHRHAMMHDVQNGNIWCPLQNLSDKQASVEIINSPLSEAGVLGFEYGYSLDSPDSLVIWEAQFGDFWNAAQVIVDQFIASGEDKWHRLSGLVMLLPHGMEGSGPEHSSARIERFMELAAEDNIQVTYPTTPAQFFHLLRRQVLRPWRKPLVVMSPKSLLRHLDAVSPLEDFTKGTFQRILPDAPARDPKSVKRILICSGKIYYELMNKREEAKRQDVAILRMEQLYPFPEKELFDALRPYADGTPVFWIQEEPMNMGAWRHMRVWLKREIDNRLPFLGMYRPPSASPATGSASSHKQEQDLLLAQAFGEVPFEH
jgi:2-oxoglutarate dehydrogenase E1 component